MKVPNVKERMRNDQREQSPELIQVWEQLVLPLAIMKNLVIHRYCLSNGKKSKNKQKTLKSAPVLTKKA